MFPLFSFLICWLCFDKTSFTTGTTLYSLNIQSKQTSTQPAFQQHFPTGMKQLIPHKFTIASSKEIPSCNYANNHCNLLFACYCHESLGEPYLISAL